MFCKICFVKLIVSLHGMFFFKFKILTQTKPVKHFSSKDLKAFLILRENNRYEWNFGHFTLTRESDKAPIKNTNANQKFLFFSYSVLDQLVLQGDANLPNLTEFSVNWDSPSIEALYYLLKHNLKLLFW